MDHQMWTINLILLAVAYGGAWSAADVWIHCSEV